MVPWLIEVAGNEAGADDEAGADVAVDQIAGAGAGSQAPLTMRVAWLSRLEQGYPQDPGPFKVTVRPASIRRGVEEVGASRCRR